MKFFSLFWIFLNCEETSRVRLFITIWARRSWGNSGVFSLTSYPSNYHTNPNYQTYFIIRTNQFEFDWCRSTRQLSMRHSNVNWSSVNDSLLTEWIVADDGSGHQLFHCQNGYVHVYKLLTVFDPCPRLSLATVWIARDRIFHERSDLLQFALYQILFCLRGKLELSAFFIMYEL